MACTILNDADYEEFLEACRAKGHDTIYSCIKSLIKDFIEDYKNTKSERKTTLMKNRP